MVKVFMTNPSYNETLGEAAMFKTSSETQFAFVLQSLVALIP